MPSKARYRNREISLGTPESKEPSTFGGFGAIVNKKRKRS